MPSKLIFDKLIITSDNIDAVKDEMTASDQQDELKVGDMISHWVVEDEHGQSFEYTAWHNEGRIACALGADSHWGDWRDDQYEDDLTKILLDDGWYADLNAERFGIIRVSNTVNAGNLITGKRVDLPLEQEARDVTMCDGYIAACFAANVLNKPCGLFRDSQGGHGYIYLSYDNLDQAIIITQPNEKLKTAYLEFAGRQFEMVLPLDTIMQIVA